MPSPIKIGNAFYIQIRTPKDIAETAKGQRIMLPIGSDVVTVTVGEFVKASLRTSDIREAKNRFITANAALERFWQALRQPPSPLAHKELLAIAGEARKAFVEAFDRNPGQPTRWMNVRATNDAARIGNLNPLTIPSSEQNAKDMERRFGELLDAVCLKHGITVPLAQRSIALSHVADAMDEVAQVNLRKSLGDYSTDFEAKKYPALQKRSAANEAEKSLTLEMVVDEEVRRRSLGRTEVPLRRATERKFKTVAQEFAAFRSSGTVHDITPRQAVQCEPPPVCRRLQLPNRMEPP